MLLSHVVIVSCIVSSNVELVKKNCYLAGNERDGRQEG